MFEGGDPELTVGEHAHYLGHQDALKPSLSVRENLAFWTNFLGGQAAQGDAALAAVGLDGLARLPANYLSAGQRRRLSLARLIAVDRPIWLLDEPTTALDTLAQEMLAGLMRTHLAGKGLILAAAHGPIGLDQARELRLGVKRNPGPMRDFRPPLARSAPPAGPRARPGSAPCRGRRLGERQQSQESLPHAPSLSLPRKRGRGRKSRNHCFAQQPAPSPSP